MLYCLTANYTPKDREVKKKGKSIVGSVLSTLVATAFFCCLLSVSFSRIAEAADAIVTGTLNCDGKLKQLPNGFSGCTQRIPVRHLGKGGPSSGNPDDYGMCGILSIDMAVTEGFAWKDDVQIIVDQSGYYTLQVGISNTSVGLKPPTAQWTCVYFSAFRGVPAISDGTGFTPAAFSSGSSVASVPISGSAGYACIWAGFEGDLAGKPSRPDSSDVAEGGASAQYYKPETKFSAQNATSYAFCSGYTAKSWNGWQYLRDTGFSTTTATSLGINKNNSWCYMDLIQDDISNFGPGYTVKASIDISKSGEYSLGGIFKAEGGSVSMGYNCLPFAQ